MGSYDNPGLSSILTTQALDVFGSTVAILDIACGDAADKSPSFKPNETANAEQDHGSKRARSAPGNARASTSSINLVVTNNQSVFQYQVRQSTNVLGWNFPLEFYGVQQLPAGTNTWKLHMTIRGQSDLNPPRAEPGNP